MTTQTTHDTKRPRSCGIPASPERALMGKAYENYATAQRLHLAAHNEWRRTRRQKATQLPSGGWSYVKADKHSAVKDALTKASKAAMLLGDARGQYKNAKIAARKAGVA